MSGTRATTRKRARTASDATSSDAQKEMVHGLEGVQSAAECARTRDVEFRYDDDSIILIARDVEFRVYKGLLADHSPVFKDMFSLPQPPITASFSSTHTDLPCPVVHLSDSPEDLRHVLRAYLPRGDSR